MVTRSGVTFLLVTFLSVSEGREKFEKKLKKYPENFECVRRNTCEYYNQRLAEYRRTKNAEIKSELQALICNKGQKAVCCRQNSAPTTPAPTTSTPTTDSRHPSSCGKPQKIPESVKIILAFLCM